MLPRFWLLGGPKGQTMTVIELSWTAKKVYNSSAVLWQCSEDAKIKSDISEWVSEWQGHLLSCPGQLKTSQTHFWSKKVNVSNRRPQLTSVDQKSVLKRGPQMTLYMSRSRATEYCSYFYTIPIPYESLSDVGEGRVWFASKNLTPCRMHWNAFLIAQIIAKCHSFPNMYGML